MAEWSGGALADSIDSILTSVAPEEVSVEGILVQALEHVTHEARAEVNYCSTSLGVC